MRPSVLILVLGVVTASLGLSGCRTDQGHYTILSTRNVELSRVDLKYTPVVRDVSKTDSRLWFLFIPLGHAPTLDTAVDRCLGSGDGDFLTNAQVKSFWWTILVFSYESYSVEADVVKTPREATREIVPSPSASPSPSPPPRTTH